MPAPGDEPGPTGKRVRVVVVDDMPEIRRLLRALLEQDGRFEVVGEGADGVEAISLAAELQPDLVILDRNMPRLGGLDAIAGIARDAPTTDVILFTASTSSGAYHAAISAGALDVIDKHLELDFVDHLARTLLDHWADDDAEVRVHVGPVSSASARLWIRNTRKVVDALKAHPEVMADPPPGEVLESFEHFLDLWQEVSEGREEFFWAARARFKDVEHIVEWWARVDALDDAGITQLGLQWSPPEARPFYHALTAAVLRAFETHAGSQELARTLRWQWTPGSVERRKVPRPLVSRSNAGT
jgi:CheY-like chemotaxis protein